MEIKLLQKSKDKSRVSFILSKSEPFFANIIRRNIINIVPTMAIDEVEFTKNSSILYDEIIAHRLGLLALKTDLKSYNVSKECKCEGAGCARCQIQLSLSEKGPKVVLASDIKSKDPKIIPVFGDTPIVKLLKGQDLEFVATAKLGDGKEHAKWIGGAVHYQYLPTVEIVKENFTNVEECVNSCPAHVYDMKSGKLVINKDNILNCTLCNACVDCAPEGAIKITGSDSDFIFTVESFGQLSAKDLLIQSAEMFEKQLSKFTELLKKSQ